MIFEKIDKDHCDHLNKNEMQKIELNILKNVVKFCDDNDIKYILYYGTLLGAVREKGFIPWDDDIDIAMPREDYERFLKTYKDSNQYILSHIDKQNNYYLPFAKVYDNYTYLNERISRKFLMGVYIDIFPIDVYDKSKFAFYFTKVKRCFLHCKLCLIKKESPIYIKILVLLGKLVSFWFPLNKGIQSMAKNRNKISTKDAKELAIIVEGLPYAKKFPAKCIEETIDWPFEDITVKIPKGYDEMLKILYGNYMIPPPPTKQKTAHETFYSGYKTKEEILNLNT